MSPQAQHPQVTEMLEQLQQFNAALDDQMRRTTLDTFSGTDEAKTVNVTLNGTRCLTGLYLEEGLLRLGADTVAERINEALVNAQAASDEAISAQQSQLFSALSGIAGSMKQTMGLS
jgi:DNA-binding protein YbaB